MTGINSIHQQYTYSLFFIEKWYVLTLSRRIVGDIQANAGPYAYLHDP